MSLAERRWLRLFTLCALYVAQGVPFGFMAVTLPAYLADRKLGEAAIAGVVAMCYAPYSFKWVLGPVIDAFTIPRFGRRRPWILFAQASMAVTIGALIFIPDLTKDVDLLVTMVMVHTIFNMMQDVAVDALAVDLLDEKERGRANGLMYASKYGGAVIGGAGMSTVMAYWDLRTALVIQVVILLAIMMLPLLVRETAGAPPPRPKIWTLVKGLVRVLTLRSPLLCVVLMLGQSMATGMLTVTAPVLFTQRLGWDSTDYAQVVGGPGLSLGLAGSVLGGFLADRVGHRRLAAIGSLGLATVWLVFALFPSLWSSDVFVYGLFLLSPLFLAMMTVSLFALCMDLAWPKIAATQFTAYMAVANLSTVFGAKLAPWASETLTDRGVYVLAAAVQIGITVLFPLIDPTQTRRVLPSDDPPSPTKSTDADAKPELPRAIAKERE